MKSHRRPSSQWSHSTIFWNYATRHRRDGRWVMFGRAYLGTANCGRGKRGSRTGADGLSSGTCTSFYGWIKNRKVVGKLWKYQSFGKSEINAAADHSKIGKGNVAKLCIRIATDVGIT